MDQARMERLSREELEAECGTALPDKEVISLLNLDVDLDVVLDLAAPIDLAVAANANAALPVNASVSANVLSFDSSSAAVANQAAGIDQGISGEAIAEAPQSATIAQGDAGTGGAESAAVQAAELDPALTEDLVNGELPGGELVDTAAGLLSDGLLNIEVNASVDADLAAPIAGAVAANANVAAPINASVSANVLSFDSQSVAVAEQTAVINQSLEDVTAHAVADQDTEITQ